MLFTFFAELEGGTYIQQITSDSVHQAVDEWFRTSVTKPEMKERNITGGDIPTPVDDVQNVWCCSFYDDGERFFLIHIVQTCLE